MTQAHEPIAFPDVEDLLVTYLTQELADRNDTATVHVQIPTVRPARFVLVPRVGGVRRNLVVDSPTIGFECWDNTAAKAYALCRLVRAFVHALPGRTVDGATFYRVEEFGGPVNLPDSLSAQARYTFTASLSVRGTAI